MGWIYLLNPFYLGDVGGFHIERGGCLALAMAHHSTPLPNLFLKLENNYKLRRFVATQVDWSSQWCESVMGFVMSSNMGLLGDAALKCNITGGCCALLAQASKE